MLNDQTFLEGGQAHRKHFCHSVKSQVGWEPRKAKLHPVHSFWVWL